jgi:hypothetical protein
MAVIRDWLALAVLSIGLACTTTPSRPPPPAVDVASGDPASVLGRFTAALQEGRWEEAYALLTARWRARSTPTRLAGDLAASGAAGREAMERVRALLASGARLAVSGPAASLRVAEGRSARLSLEDGAWRVDALE